jgi:hypothetical protein
MLPAKTTAHGQSDKASIVSRVPLQRRTPSRSGRSFGVAHLLSAAGNLAVQGLLHTPTIQAKLRIGEPDDEYEREADRLANHVVSTTETPVVQRTCDCGGTNTSHEPCDECRKKDKEEAVVQRRHANHIGPASAPPIVHDVVRSTGQPLEPATRTFMESRLRHDFGSVRVHTGTLAAESAGAVGALAYTVGQNVVFGPGQYAPGSEAGRRLIAHELVHTVQQGDSTDTAVQRTCSQSSDESFYRSAPNYCSDTGFSGIFHSGQCYREVPVRSSYTDCPPGDQVCFSDGKCEDSYDKVSTVESKNADGSCNLHGYCFLGHAAMDILPGMLGEPQARELTGCLDSCDSLDGFEEEMCRMQCHRDQRPPGM